MPLKRTAATTTPVTPMTYAQIRALISQVVADALAERDTDRSRYGDDNRDSRIGIRRQVHVARECTYTDFLKCQPLNIKGTEGVVGEIKKLEIKLWNLKVKGIDVLSYNQRFHELASICGRMFTKESDELEKYVGALLDMIQESVMASKPKKMRDAIEFATELMDQKICTVAERQAENKRKEKKPYRGSKPMCLKCNYHHDRQCAPKCTNYKRAGHLAWDCKSLAAAANNKPESPRGKSKSSHLLRVAYDVDTAGTNPNTNVVTGTFLLNNRYASILFDTGADRSFMSTAFSSLIDIIPTILDHGYDVELADDRIIWVNTLIRGCILNFLNRPFNIDLMPVEMGSFDVIIGMDCWFKGSSTNASNENAQWRSRFLRYIDIRPNGDALRKCILEGPYTPSTVIIPAVPATDNSSAVPKQTTIETVLNMSPENKAHFESEKEAIHLILTGIGDEIYLTVDACKAAHEMWEAIERLQQVAMMQVNVQFLQQLQPEWSRFVTVVKQQHKLDEVSYHKLFDFLKQYQEEVNELRVKRIAKNANPLALVATAQPYQDLYYQAPKSHKS
ncbi:putative reverse transcriptase domain-containing protein, partial [Tanacetum coccineum]